MEPQFEKKWFIYLEDHHEGPFSALDIKDKIQGGVFSTDSYVWSEGMQDWKPATEVQELVSHLQSHGEAQTSALPGSSDGGLQLSASESTDSDLPFTLSAEVQEASPIIYEEKTEPTLTLSASHTTNENLTASHHSIATKNFKPDAKEKGPIQLNGISVKGGSSFLQRILKPVLFLAFIAGGYFSYSNGYLDPVLKAVQPQLTKLKEQDFLKNFNVTQIWESTQSKISSAIQPALNLVAERIPVLAQWISTFPKIDGVSEEDYIQLRKAAQTQVNSNVLVGLGLLNTNIQSPVFYVSSNLPPQSSFIVHLEGVSETLLNQLDYSTQVKVDLGQDHLIKTPSIFQKDGKTLPKGQYVVYVYEATEQPAETKNLLLAAPDQVGTALPKGITGRKKVLIQKRYFLGGEKDSNYEDRLKEYHAKVRVRAKEDYAELKQTIQVLITQYNSSFEQFRIYKSKNEQSSKNKSEHSVSSSIKNDWNKKYASWAKFQKEFQSFKKWNDEFLISSFYRAQFESIKEAAQSLTLMSEVENEYFNKKIQMTNYFSKLNTVQLEANQKITNLLSKLRQIETDLSSGTGLPKRIE